MNAVFLRTARLAKRTVIFVVGTTVLCIGLAMIVLPGPAFVVIPAGLGILAIEFVWARNLLEKTKNHIVNYKNRKNNNLSHLPKEER